MREGVIEKLISYYVDNEKFKLEMERARNDFFNLSEVIIIVSVEEKYMPFFMEWLVYDFRLSNDKSLLEDYYYRNPRKLPLYEMQIYKDLQDNIYGLLEAKKIDLGEGLEVLMLNTGKKYYVREHLATFDLKKGDLIFNRVAKVGDHWELVGADSFKIEVRMNSETKKLFIDKNAKYGPKDTIKFLERDELKDKYKNEEADEAEIPMDELIAEIDNFFKEIGIDSMVKASLIQKWLLRINFKNKPAAIIGTLFSLTEEKPSSEQGNRLINLVRQLINYSPQKALKGKSPNELRKEVEFGSKGFSFSVTNMGDWANYANRATRYLKSGEISKAFSEYEKTFEILLKEKIAIRYIFSIYANMAICYLYFGEEFMARKLLGVALILNSKYEFAQNLIKKLDNYENVDHLAESIRFVLRKTRFKKLKEFWQKVKDYGDIDLCQAYFDLSVKDFKNEWEYSSANEYYNFLRKLEINFTMEK